MIVTEYYATRDDGVKLYRTYSDSGKSVKQIETGTIYGEAVDVENAPYTYTETTETAEEDTLTAQEKLQQIEEVYADDV